MSVLEDKDKYYRIIFSCLFQAHSQGNGFALRTGAELLPILIGVCLTKTFLISVPDTGRNASVIYEKGEFN